MLFHFNLLPTRVITIQNVWEGEEGATDFTDWLFFLLTVLSIINTMSVTNTMLKITTGVGKTAAFAD